MQPTYKPETLLVKRDGQLDDEYYAALYAEKRQAALQAAGREVLHIALQVPVVVGKGILYLLTHDLQPDTSLSK